MVRTLKETKSSYERPKGWGMFHTHYGKKTLAERHAKRLERTDLLTTAIVKTPKGWNVLHKSNKRSLELVRKQVAKRG